ncbi:hypothetical protein EAE99_010196 [Botrytis elliptica]|nr:hypothetical protein EAE99_010196 [Botrytis elliptica]
MAERKLIVYDGQPEDFQLAVAKVLDLIKSRYEKHESLLQNCKRLAIYSPVLALESSFGYKPKDITFVQLFNLTLEKKKEQLTYDHLWKVSDGYALVHDYIALIVKPGRELANYRTINLLDDGLHNSGKRCLQYKLTSNVAICNQELSPPKNNQVEIDTFSDSSLSSSLSSSLPNTLDFEIGNEKISVDNCKLSSDWLIDFDNPPLHIPALEAEKRSGKAAADSTTMKWKSARVIESREEDIQTREANLDKIERDITARVVELEARESAIDFHEQEFNTRLSAVMTRENEAEIRERELLASWTQYSKLYSETQKFKIDLKDREFDLNQREFSVEQGEAANAELEKITRAKITAELKFRILDAESIEESIVIRNVALKECEERLNEREQLAVVDRKALEVEYARVASRMDEIKIHEDIVGVAETSFRSREEAHKKIRDEFKAREALIGEREAALQLKEDDAMENYFAFFKNPTGPLYTALGLVEKKQEKHNSEMVARELAVLEREQKVAASEAALKLEREMIRIRLRENEEMKQLADATELADMKNCKIEGQVETKNQEIAECVAEKKRSPKAKK